MIFPPNIDTQIRTKLSYGVPWNCIDSRDSNLLCFISRRKNNIGRLSSNL